MRRASLAAALFVLVLTVPAGAQASASSSTPATTTTPSPAAAGLVRENAELRAYAEKLEARIVELERANKKLRVEAAARAQARPFGPAPYGYQLPQPPFRLAPPATPAPVPPPGNLRILPTPPQPIPDTWRRHHFNGQEFYLVPLE